MTLRDFLSTYAFPIGVGLGLLWAWARNRGRLHAGTPIDVSDPRWSEAIAKARGTVGDMRCLFETGASDLYVTLERMKPRDRS